MLENMIMIGGAQAILGRIGHELEFAQQLEKEAGVTWKTNAKAMIAAESATITTHAVLNIALSYVARQVTNAAGLRKQSEREIAANSGQLNDWFMQGLSVGLGRLVHSRFAPRVAMYKKLAELPQLPQARLLLPRAEGLLKLASTSESSPSGELLPPLMAKPRELLTEERSVLDELGRNPEARRAAGMSNNDVAAARHRNAADGADMYVPGSESVPLMNAGLEDLGAGKLWAGTSKQIAAAIDSARQSNLDVHDSNVNGVHKVTIEKQMFEVHERAESPHRDARPGRGTAAEPAADDESHKPAHERTTQRMPAVDPSAIDESHKPAHERTTQQMPAVDSSHALHAAAETKVMFTGRGDRLAAAARNLQPEPGYFDVVVHGAPNKFWVLHDGQWTTVTPNSVRTMIGKQPGYTGQPIRLVSCEAGTLDNGIAQAIANGLGVHVKAPTETAWIMADGSVVVGYTPPTRRASGATSSRSRQTARGSREPRRRSPIRALQSTMGRAWRRLTRTPHTQLGDPPKRHIPARWPRTATGSQSSWVRAARSTSMPCKGMRMLLSPSLERA